MKKTSFITAILALGLATTAAAGESVVVTAPALEPAPAPTQEAIAAPATTSPLSWELALSVNLANNDIITDEGMGRVKLSTIGYDLTGVYALNENNALTLRLGFANGKDTCTTSYDGGSWKDSYTMYSFYLMPGYRYTTSLSDSTKGFVGINAGIINHSLKYRFSAFDGRESFISKLHDSDYGFAASVEAGLSFALSKSTSLFLAYQFSGSTAKPKLIDDGYGITAHKQFFHSIRTGISLQF